MVRGWLLLVSMAGAFVAAADLAGATAAKPDLVGKLVRILPGRNIHRGEEQRIVLRLTNKGAAPAKARIAVDLLVGGGTLNRVRKWYRCDLAPGKSATFTHVSTVPNEAADGPANLSIKLDATNVVKESKETNNTVPLGVFTVVP